MSDDEYVDKSYVVKTKSLCVALRTLIHMNSDISVNGAKELIVTNLKTGDVHTFDSSVWHGEQQLDQDEFLVEWKSKKVN